MPAYLCDSIGQIARMPYAHCLSGARGAAGQCQRSTGGMRLVSDCMLRAMGLTKRYGNFTAVDNINLEVHAGEVLGVLGLNGAGKSTTLTMLTGLVRPTAGSISMFGKDLRKGYIEIASRVGYLIERPALYEYLSVRDNLVLSMKVAGRSADVDGVLELVDLHDVPKRKARALSTGMRQRLGLAQAILFEPEFVILDEPTSGLDPEATRELLSLLQRLTREMGITLMFSSHMLREVEELCDRVLIIHKGKLAADESMEKLLAYDASRLDVLIAEAEPAAQALAAEPWIESAQARSGAVSVVLNGAPPSQLIAYLVHKGFEANAVIPRRGTLHEFFLKVLKS